MKVKPITLTGRVVRLEPLSEDHIPDLALAAQYKSIWRYMVYGDLSTGEGIRPWVLDMLALQRRGTDLPFAVHHLQAGRAIGATRYLDIQPENNTLEIGGTWYAVPFQRTAVNTESKLLLLQHAFETLGCHRVQLKTDQRNIPSQRAIERLGAVKEGVLREHMILPDGYLRSSVYYSILASEWPAVKTLLQNKLTHRNE